MPSFYIIMAAQSIIIKYNYCNYTELVIPSFFIILAMYPIII